MIPVQISKARFDGLCVVRTPGTEDWAPEVEWWSIDSDRLIGVVSHDLTDDDWTWIVLERDDQGVFRAIEIRCLIPTQKEASDELQAAIIRRASAHQTTPSEAPPSEKTCNLLIPVVAEDRLHPHFKKLIYSREFSPTAAFLREFSPVFTDVDGNFTEQFQTTAFNARLWELYLDLMLREQGFQRITDFDRPDYCVIKHGLPIGIEAVTVNPSSSFPMPDATNVEESQQILTDFMPLRFSGPLMAKLGKRYWELPHMTGVPFCIAIHDYFTDESMTWSMGSLSQYLFGLRGEGFRHADGNVDASFQPIGEHVWGTKRLQSGFFDQPGAENVSAVLANNSASLSKFNRIGKEAGFGASSVRMRRIGHQWNPAPDAATPITFEYEVSAENPREKWADGLVLFVNPNAINPLPTDLFQWGALHTVEEGRVVSFVRDHHVLSSRTLITV